MANYKGCSLATPKISKANLRLAVRANTNDDDLSKNSKFMPVYLKVSFVSQKQSQKQLTNC